MGYDKAPLSLRAVIRSHRRDYELRFGRPFPGDDEIIFEIVAESSEDPDSNEAVITSMLWWEGSHQ